MTINGMIMKATGMQTSDKSCSHTACSTDTSWMLCRILSFSPEGLGSWEFREDPYPLVFWYIIKHGNVKSPVNRSFEGGYHSGKPLGEIEKLYGSLWTLLCFH